MMPHESMPKSFIWGAAISTTTNEDTPYLPNIREESISAPYKSMTILKNQHRSSKPKYFMNKQANQSHQPNQHGRMSLLKSTMENSLLRNSYLNKTNQNYSTINSTKNPNNNYDSLESLENNNMISMMIDNCENSLNNNSHNNNNIKENQSNSYVSHTNNDGNMVDSLNEDQFLNKTINKSSPFIFNYNSLMNVSMLDNIQATNTNHELDNMNSSILLFN
jgi:hypothetical protein